MFQKSSRTALMFQRENIQTLASFHEAQLQLLNAFSENVINDKKFLLLEDINSSKKKEPPYCNHDYFELDSPKKGNSIME